MADLLAKALKAAADALRPLADPEVRAAMLEGLGVPADKAKAEMLSPQVQALLEEILDAPDPDLASKLASYLGGAGQLYLALTNIRDAFGAFRDGDHVTGTDLTIETLLHLLPNWLLVCWLRLRHPGLYAILRAAQFIDDRAALPFGDTFNGQRWKSLFVVQHENDGDDDFRFFHRETDHARAQNSVAIGIAATLLGQFGHKLVGLGPGLEDTPRFPVPIQFRAYAGWDPSPFTTTPRADKQLFHFTTLDIVATAQPKDPVEAATATLVEQVLRLTMVVPPKDIDPPLLVRPEGQVAVSRKLGDWEIVLAGAGKVEGGGGPSAYDISLKASRDGRLRPLTITDWLQLGDLHFSGWMSSKDELGIRLESRGNKLKVRGDDPVTKMAMDGSRSEVAFDLDLQLDSVNKLRFGSTGVVVDVPIGLNIGPVRIQQLRARIGLTEDGKGLEVTAAVGLRFKLGPLAAVAEGVGFRLRADGSEPKNLLFLHLEAGFKPPEGVGLSLDAAGCVKGAGYLGKDAATNQYVGVFEVQLTERFRLSIIGLLATRMPDGTEAISLFLQGGLGISPGVPLGSTGLSLTRVGLMFGYNRRFDLAAFRAGIKTGLLEALLAPPDPLANMAQTVSQLTTLFPPTLGAHTIAVTAQLSRGEPLKIDLGLLYDTSQPLRIVTVGRIQIDCMKAGKLKLAAVGVLDLAAGELTLEAHIYDSKLMGIEVSGDAAMLIRWESPRAFVLAIGGFHKDFRGPERSLPVFSSLGRFTLKLPDSEVLKLTLTAYFAVTPNTLQLGAQVDAFVGIESLVTLEGSFGFDALFEFEPFYFEAEVRGRVRLSVLGETVAGARLEGRMRGPTPTRVSGKVTFEVLWWDVSYSFDRSLGGTEPPPPPAVDPVELLRAELQNTQVWEGGALPAGAGTVRLSQKPTAGRLLLHPLQPLKFVQAAVPLDQMIEKVGGRPVPAAGPVRLTGASLGGAPATTEPVMEQFSRGRYQKLTKEQLFDTPPFEEMVAGAVIVSDTAVSVGEGATATTEPVEIRIGEAERDPAPGSTEPASPIPVEILIARSATVEALRRRPGRERFFMRAGVIQ